MSKPYFIGATSASMGTMLINLNKVETIKERFPGREDKNSDVEIFFNTNDFLIVDGPISRFDYLLDNPY
jgi:hypothetical protein